MSIKQTLQSEEWDCFLRSEAAEGNKDAIEILNWMKKNRWFRSQRHLRPKPYLKGVKPKIEV